MEVVTIGYRWLQRVETVEFVW